MLRNSAFFDVIECVLFCIWPRVVCWQCNVTAVFKSDQCLVNCGRHTREPVLEDVVLCSPFDQLHSRRVDRLRFCVAVPTESEDFKNQGVGGAGGG